MISAKLSVRQTRKFFFHCAGGGGDPLVGGPGGKGGGGRCTHVMHGRSRVTIDPRIPAMPGRSTSARVCGGGVLVFCLP